MYIMTTVSSIGPNVKRMIKFTDECTEKTNGQTDQLKTLQPELFYPNNDSRRGYKT